MPRKSRKKKVERRRPSQRAQMEQTLGRKLLRGEIPVVPPSQLHRCPVPSTHVEHDQLCKDYQTGKISYDALLEKVGESLKKPEPKGQSGVEGGIIGEGESTSTSTSGESSEQ